MSEEFHLSCQICLSLFLLDGPSEAEPVAAPCGHVFHRDCVEAFMETRNQPLCTICRAPLPDVTAGLLKLYLNLEETGFDRDLQKAIHEATAPEAPVLDVTLAIQECEEKLVALREEQQYNQQVLAALEKQWIAIDQLHDGAQKRVKNLEDRLRVLTERLKELESRQE
ncbi:hypothetical protein FKP32DRAFT_1677181 [Trametes sanguinea]|nr:hypothetical protein FKP32DRAFT_1677181 [Trametes sanguinea]